MEQPKQNPSDAGSSSNVEGAAASSDPVVLTAEDLQQMKRVAQERDQANAKHVDISNGDRLLLSPAEIHSAKVTWPKKLRD